MNTMTTATFPPTAASASAALPLLQQSLERLDRLNAYLHADPKNNALRIDAFETALSCRAWERASQYLEEARSTGVDALGWQLREGDFWLAQREDEKASAVLRRLQATATDNPTLQQVLTHNLAFIDFRHQHYAEAIAQLDATMQRPMIAEQQHQSTVTAALQTLWLRAHHHAGRLDEACTWVQQLEQGGQRLAPAAAGVAALIAVDANALELAQRWCAAATCEEAAPWSAEALVAAGTLALGERRAGRARQLADAALERNGQEGRAWALRSFAQMLEQDFSGALVSFAEAVHHAPEHIGTWIGRGWTQMLMQDLAGARTSFEAALALDRNFGESHGGLAVVLALQGERAAAEQHAEWALRLDHRNLSAQFARALLGGEIVDQASLLRLAKRLLGGIDLLEGGVASDLLKMQPRKK